MLEHQKKVISNVSFDHEMFEKEIRKAVEWLTVDEVEELEMWLRKNYMNTHRKVLLKIFSIVAA